MNTHTMNTHTYPLTGLHCNACVKRVTQALQPLADSVAVSLSPMQVVVTGAKTEFANLQAAVSGAGKYELMAAAQTQLPLQTSVAEVAPAPVATTALAPPAPTSAVSSWWATYRPLLLLLAYILGASVLVQLAHGGGVQATETMRLFMAGFFLAFSFFKLLDLPAFADAYTGYDLLAMRWRGWGYVYPFVELALGAAYLSHANPVLTHSVTIAVMGFSAIGVIRAVLAKRQIRCACLGAVFNLPMSTVTIVEDVGMVLMASWMLWLV